VTFGSSTTLNLRRREEVRREGVFLRAALVVFLLVGVAIFYLWNHAQVTNVGLKLSTLRKEQAKVLEERQRLWMERVSLMNLKRIEEYASTKLGMVYPDPADIRGVRGP